MACQALAKGTIMWRGDKKCKRPFHAAPLAASAPAPTPPAGGGVRSGRTAGEGDGFKATYENLRQSSLVSSLSTSKVTILTLRLYLIMSPATEQPSIR